MTDYNIHDFIENYRDQNYEDIQWDISCRKEFNDLKFKGKEPIPDKGKYFKHQDIFLRYVKEYDRIFNIHETGTGKTGSIINVVEYFRLNEPGRIKKVFVLQPGPATVNDFKNQIVKLSNINYYKDFSEEDQINKNLVTRLINKNYDINTYQKFYKDDVDEENIINYYSDSIFFLDECHKLRNLSDSKGEKLTEDQINKIYDYIWKIFHIAERIKIVISTATPMINNVKDYVPLLNLLLDKDNQLPLIKEESYYENLTLQQLEPFFRGKFTFVRFGDTGIELSNKGQFNIKYEHKIKIPLENKLNKINTISKEIVKNEIINSKETMKFNLLKNQTLNETKMKNYKSEISIFPVTMKGIQLETFEKVEKKKQDSFFREIRQCSIFVFPNGSYGTKGFNNYIEKDEYGNYFFKKSVIINGKPLNSLNNYITSKNIEKTIDNISFLSSKFSFFLKKEYECSKRERPGNSFCYIDQVSGSGIILLGIILEKLGFERFTSNDINILDKKRRIKDYFKKKKRFCLFTGSSSNISNAINIFNSTDNLDGEYIQIIIGSEVIRDGVNIENVVRGYMMTPGWHESGIHQAMSRFIRATSHEKLIERNKIELKEGNKKFENYRLEVEVYKLASIKPDEKNDSIDIYLYLKSEEKDIKIKRVIRFMKQCSFDAYLNYKRNVISSDVDYTKSSDYQLREIKIWNSRGMPNNNKRKGMAGNQGPDKKDYIFNTYDILYSSFYFDYIRIILPIFIKRYKIAPIGKVIKDVKESVFENFKIDINDFVVYISLKKIVEEKLWINDEINLNSFNIIFVGNNIFMERISLNNTFNNTPCDVDIILQNSIKLQKTSIIDENNILKDIYNDLKDKNENYIIEYYGRNQNYESFKLLLEDCLKRKLNNDTDKLVKIILKIFSNYYILTEAPENWLKETENSLKPLQERTQGRNRAEGSLAGLKDIDFSKIKPGYKKPKTYIHFYRESDKTGFSITSILEGKERKIRILEGKDFRNANITENFVYTYMFDKYYDELMKKYKSRKYYGSYILRGGEQEKVYSKRSREFFRIIDSTNPRNKGRVCTNNNSEILQEVLKYIDTEKKHKNLYTGKVNKNTLCQILKEMFIKKDLLFWSL